MQRYTTRPVLLLSSNALNNGVCPRFFWFACGTSHLVSKTNCPSVRIFRFGLIDGLIVTGMIAASSCTNLKPYFTPISLVILYLISSARFALLS